jgi:UDP-2,3-diacylglucosamine hydrolase
MNVRHIFLSDVHYGAFDDETNREVGRDLMRLIDFCSENHIRLHILGDLFDYWMEYPGHFPDLGAHILEKFKMYFTKTGSVLYITGNHDNWTRGYFDELGFDVEPEYRILRLNGNSILLHHGDGFENKKMKLPRPWLHRLLRNRYFIKFYQFLLPPKTGLKLMKKFSDHCRKRPIAGTERLNNWSKDYLSKNDIDFVICGHDHIPRIETFPFGTYINSGTFYSHRTVVAYTNGDFKLVRWNGTQNTLTPFTREINLIQNEQLYGT